MSFFVDDSLCDSFGGGITIDEAGQRGIGRYKKAP